MGFSLKRNIDEFKTEVSEKILDLRTDVQNAINIQNQFNPQIVFPEYHPSRDERLETLEGELRDVMESLIERGTYIQTDTPEETPLFEVSEDIQKAIVARHKIEIEVRNLAAQYLDIGFDRKRTFASINKILVRV